MQTFPLQLAAFTEEVRNDPAQACQSTSRPVNRANLTPDQASSSTEAL